MALVAQRKRGNDHMLDIFDILGPVMWARPVPTRRERSASGSMARTLLGDEPVEAKIHLHGSFAETAPSRHRPALVPVFWA